jgi:hypothetical protein
VNWVVAAAERDWCSVLTARFVLSPGVDQATLVEVIMNAFDFPPEFRERIYLDRFWNEFSANPARFSEAAL